MTANFNKFNSIKYYKLYEYNYEVTKAIRYYTNYWYNYITK